MPCTFNDRLDRHGHNAIRPWLNEIPEKARLKIDWVLRNVALRDTLYPYFKKVQGYDDLLELRVEINKIQYRPLGGYGPNAGEFTLVLGAIEHNDHLRPSNAFATAAGYVASVKAKTCKVCDHDYEKTTPTTARQSEK
jgi:hypothetical protein